MKKIDKTTYFWLLAGIIGLLIFIKFFNYAFPAASINIRFTGKEIIRKASNFVKAQGFDLKGFDQTVVFDSDYQASIYLQKTQGIKKSNELIQQGIPVWFWSVRWFKELKKDGFYCALDPSTGEVIHFQHFMLDDEAGGNLDIDQAMNFAIDQAKSQGIDLANYELKENEQKKQKNRTDYHYVWQKKDYAIDDATLRFGISIFGNTLGYYGKFLDVPEEFNRNLTKEISLGQMLSIITMIFMFSFFIGAIVILAIQFKKDKINWKFGLIPGVLICLISIIEFINNIPLLWSAYPDTISKNVFLATSAGVQLIGALLIGLMVFLFGSSGESLSHDMLSLKMPMVNFFKQKSRKDSDVLDSLIVGYSSAFIFLGYITLFYLWGRKFFNIWMPPEAEYSNMLGASFPILAPLIIALTASVSEEFIFRLFAIPFLKKCLKLTWLGVLLPAMVWAFAHSNYPVFPAYVRGIELTIAGIVFGMIFLKYGLGAVLISHFVIDAVLVVIPLLKSGNSYFYLSGIIVIVTMFIPVFFILAMKNKKLKK
ncbi:MAG: type II CAAX endopeptidase family protein [Candidatus Omnitrophota bacterium]